MEDFKTFGELIKHLRKNTQFRENGGIITGISLREFARRVGMDPGNWQRVETDKLKPPVKKIAKIVEVLNISPYTYEIMIILARRAYLPEELW